MDKKALLFVCISGFLIGKLTNGLEGIDWFSSKSIISSSIVLICVHFKSSLRIPVITVELVCMFLTLIAGFDYLRTHRTFIYTNYEMLIYLMAAIEFIIIVGGIWFDGIHQRKLRNADTNPNRNENDRMCSNSI